MEVVWCDMGDERVVPLLEALTADYEALYGPNDEVARYAASAFEPPNGVFVVVTEDGRTVAGGGYRRYDDTTCEIKRVWTDHTQRRRGLASTVIDSLLRAAVAAGYERVILETGPLQPAAVALYERLGFSRIPPFGPYPDDQGFELVLAERP